MLNQKVQPKTWGPAVFVFSCYVTELKKNTNFRKNPMREKKVIYRFVCDAIKMAKPEMGVKLSDSDYAHLLYFRVCHPNKTKLLLSIFMFLLLFLVYGCFVV